MCNGKRFVTRKDLARELEVSTQTIARNEQRLGLDAARCDMNSRMVRYDSNIAHKNLVESGALPKDK